ncbi:MAG: hypothetical protein WAW96_08130 [Alphaproteobacteria bacterium]
MLEKLLNHGWDYHATESERLARELEMAAASAIEPAHFAPFLHLSNHTIGEHLRDWRRARTVADCVLATAEPTSETARAWGRLYVARLLGGDPVGATEAELKYVGASNAGWDAALLDTRCMLANAMIGSKQLNDGARTYRAALALARRVEPTPALSRGIAAASNNIAWDLHDSASRSTGEDELMRLAADASHEYWLKCGTWINEELALYLKARVANELGDYQRAIANADQALAIISANGKRPLDTAQLNLARARAFAKLADARELARALASADDAAAELSDPALRDQFASERAKVLSDSR